MLTTNNLIFNHSKIDWFRFGDYIYLKKYSFMLQYALKRGDNSEYI